MSDKEVFQATLQSLTEAKVINDPELNLRSKMDSILRSIENLTAKKLRIEYQIKVQKRSLARKRNELKKSSKHLRVSLESSTSDPGLLSESSSPVGLLRAMDADLLRMSAEILDQD